MSANAILTNWIFLLGGPDISVADMGPRFTGANVLQFCRDHNVALQTVISGLFKLYGVLKGDIGILMISRNKL